MFGDNFVPCLGVFLVARTVWKFGYGSSPRCQSYVRGLELPQVGPL